MANKARATEHSGSKKGEGAYWGRKAHAKKESNRKRRGNAKLAIETSLRDENRG